MERFTRLQNALGAENLQKLARTRVLVFGVGGVGGFVVETLARCAVGSITVVDGDVVAKSNINRQIIALESTLGKSKAEVIKQRIADVNPDCTVCAVSEYYDETTAHKFDFTAYDYVVDAIDDVRAKADIITRCAELGVKIITSMGTANHVDPTKFKIDDIYKTDVCPLARVMRKRLKDNGVEKGKVKALYSTEIPLKREGLSSVAFCPSIAGILIAKEVVNDICKG